MMYVYVCISLHINRQTEKAMTFIVDIKCSGFIQWQHINIQIHAYV
jgi:hypothetical protein